MAHCQEQNWFYMIRIKDGKYGIKLGLDLPVTGCFDQTFHLKLCRKQTNTWKKRYQTCPNAYYYLPYSTVFDYLPTKHRKTDPAKLYTLHFRIVRLEIAKGKYESLVTNTDYSPEHLKKLNASRWGIETSFRDLKYSIGLINFHAKKKEGIIQ